MKKTVKKGYIESIVIDNLLYKYYHTLFENRICVII